MARQAREISKSGNYYVILRGQELFVTEEDKEKFLEILTEKVGSGKIHGVEITKDEIRMALKEGEGGISMNMKSVTTVYARYFNRVNNREGKLFEGRFRSTPLETKAEIDECVKNLKSGTAKTAAPKKAEEKPKAPAKKKPAQKKAEEKKPEAKQAPKQNLPSWLL